MDKKGWKSDAKFWVRGGVIMLKKDGKVLPSSGSGEE